MTARRRAVQPRQPAAAFDHCAGSSYPALPDCHLLAPDLRSGAEAIVRAMRRIADRGTTVVATIHQPSEPIFAAFDDVLLLAPGGWQVYAGPRADLVPALLTRHPDLPPCEPGTNPATWALQITAGGGSAGHAALPGGAALKHSLQSSAAHAELLAALDAEERAADALAKDGGQAPGRVARLAAAVGAGASPARLVGLLVARNVRALARNDEYTGAVLGGLLVIALLFGGVYWRLGLPAQPTTLAGVASVAGLLVNVAMIFAITPAQAALAQVFSERAVALRELGAGTYSVGVLCAATAMTHAAAVLVLAPVPAAILYGMAGLRPDGAAFGGLLAVFAANCVAMLCQVLAFAALSRTLEGAQTASIVSLMVQALYSGLFIPAGDMAPSARWLNRINPLALAAEALIMGQAAGVEDAQLQVVAADGTPVSVPRDAYLASTFGFSYGRRWANVGYLLAWAAGFLAVYVLASHTVKTSTR